MSVKVLTRAMFIVWITAITVLAVIPHSDDGIMVSSNLTTSGMEKHLIGYFIAALLCYYAYAKKEDRGRRSEIRGHPSEIENKKAFHGVKRVKG